MRRSRFLIFILLSTAVLTAGFQCDKDRGVAVKPFAEFSERITLFPYKKVYKINDTIWLQFETTDKTLFDKLTGRRIATDSTFLRVYIKYNRKYPRENLIEFFTKGEVITGTNPSLDIPFADHNTFQFRTECTNLYKFQVYFVLLKKGIYTLQPSASLSNCPDKVIHQYSTFKFTFDLADCNKDIWLSIPSRERAGESAFEHFGIETKEVFAFKVE